MEGDCNVYAHSSLWMRPTRPDRYNAKMVNRNDTRTIGLTVNRITDYLEDQDMSGFCFVISLFLINLILSKHCPSIILFPFPQNGA